MGFRRKKFQNKGSNYQKEDKFHPKRAIVGVILIAVGILIINWSLAQRYGLDFSINMAMLGLVIILAGIFLLAWSPSKKGRRKIGRILDNFSKSNCNCCKCTNCDRNHNHWVHDDSDTRRRHY